MMKSNHLALLLTILVFASPIGSLAQQAAQDVPLLTLDDAVSIALSNNRLVKNSALEAEKYDFQVSTTAQPAAATLSIFGHSVANCCSRLISLLPRAFSGRIQGLGPFLQQMPRFTRQHS